MTTNRNVTGCDRAPRVVVVGAGVSGLCAAAEISRLAPAAEVLVLEREPRPGGLIDTERTADGFVVEHGPDSLVMTKPENRRVIEDLELGSRVVRSAGAPPRSFLARGSALVPMPDGLSAGLPSQLAPWLRSPLLSLSGKARLCAEPLVPRSRDEDDETVAGFVTRRFGKQVLERVVDPLMMGIYGAAAEQLSVQASMPQLVELERKHGSIAWGMHKARTARAMQDGSGPSVVSLEGGMSTLTDTLAHRLGSSLRLGSGVTRVSRGQGSHARAFRLELTDGTLEADGLVLATPAYVAAPLLEELDAELSSALSGVQHGALASVSFAWSRRDVPHPMNGSGFIVPANERRAISACSFMCCKWPGRAPGGYALIRAFLRGVTPEMHAGDLLSLARADLRDLMGIDAEPLWARIKRRQRALPRYAVGHAQRVTRMMERAQALGPLALAGNAYLGVGIGECLASGRLAAQRVLAAIA